MEGFIMLLDGVLPRGFVKRCLAILTAVLVSLFWFARLAYHLDQVFLFNPALCLVNGLTGFYCPFCGSTRAVQSAFNGNFAAAFEMNPAVVALAPASLFVAAFSKKRPVGSIWLFMAAVLFLFGVLRNIPLWPFDLLAPR